MATFSDNFDRANSTSLGASWAEDSGDFQISTNRLIQVTTSGTYRKARHTGTFDTNNYWVEADITLQDASVGWAVFARGAVSATVTYYAYIFFGGDASYIVEITGGSETILATGGSASLTTYTNCRIEVNGSTITCTRNGAADVSTTDATLTSGAGGIATYGGSIGSSGYADNYEAQDLVSSQTITGALYTDADTFYAGTVTPGTATITGALYTDGDTFYGGTVSQAGGSQTITGTLFSDSDSFYSGSVNLTIVGRTLTPTGFALDFKGNGTGDIDRVKIPIDRTSNPNPVDVGSDFTVEAWIAPTADNDAAGITQGSGMLWVTGNIFIDRDTYGDGDYGDFGLSLANGRVAFGVGVGASAYTIVGTTDLRDGDWHHVAATRNATTGALVVYVDGVQDASGTGPTGDASYNDGRSTSYPNSDPYLVLGAEKHDLDPGSYPPYYGGMQLLRISNTIRYTGTFEPPRVLSDDANTAGLYLFDEGNSTTLGDSATLTGSPTDGTINVGGTPTGPEWIPSDLPYTWAGAGVFSVGSGQTITGALFTDDDTFYAGTVVPGEVTITGALFSDDDAFYAGTVVPGEVTITGALFSDDDAFYAGTVVPGEVTITGALFSDDDAFYAGTVVPGEVTITGALFSDDDAFYAGTVVPGEVTITGALFSDDDAFYGGTVTTATTITGALFSDDDTFYGGTVSVEGGPQYINGARFDDADSFYAGVVQPGEVTITGSPFTDSDSFYAGTFVPGAVTITGALYTDPDTFYAGAINTGGAPQTITGALYTDADSFYSGTIATAYTITGALYTDTDNFYGGTIQTGPVTITGALYTDADTFFAGYVVTIVIKSMAVVFSKRYTAETFAKRYEDFSF
jgi:hypothetical protein